MTDQKERLSWQSSTNPAVPPARPLATSASYTSDSQSETFVYDELGNRVTLNNRAGSDVLYANNRANEYTSIGGASVLYDAAGNISRDDRGFEYAYDYDNRLTQVTWIGTGGPAAVGEFAYDALGRMITAYTRFDSDVNGDGETPRYYHDGGNVLMEYDDSQTPVLQRYYIHGTGYVDERAVMHDAANEADYYYTLKDLYSVDALINNRGHEVERVTYDAYGMPLMSSIHVADVDYSGTVNATDTAAVVANYGLSVGTVGPIYDIDGNGAINATDSGLVSAAYGSAIGTARVSSVGNPYLFTGRRMHFFETEFTGLGPEANTPIQYNRARHYDPQHGRWLQRDPIEYVDGMHLYEYGGSGPTAVVDPAGLDLQATTPEALDSDEGGTPTDKPFAEKCNCACIIELARNVPGGISASGNYHYGVWVQDCQCRTYTLEASSLTLSVKKVVRWDNGQLISSGTTRMDMLASFNKTGLGAKLAFHRRVTKTARCQDCEALRKLADSWRDRAHPYRAILGPNSNSYVGVLFKEAGETFFRGTHHTE
jgi:RHS repeat-associated protein